MSPNTAFRWATGVECSFIPHLGIDQYRWTQHDRCWREDFALVSSDLGCRWLRYALPWHEIERAPGAALDWRWLDERLALAESLGIRLMLDLVHFGAPAWLPDAFADPDFPGALERFARAFGERYAGRVHTVCPINEPLITALFCGDVGLWPPYGKGLQSYTAVLTRVTQGLSRAVRVLRETMPGVEILVCDSLEVAFTHEPDSGPATSRYLRETLGEDVARRMHRRHIVMDLLLGRVDARHPLLPWLREHGMSDYDLHWFERNPQTLDLVGLDYYEHTEVELYTTPEGYYRQRALQPPMGLYRAAQDYWNKYRVPLMVTETSATGLDADKIAWLEKSVDDVRRLRADGIPVVGYTWWPVIDHLDWDGALLHQTGHIHPSGIYRLERSGAGRLERSATGLRDAYRALIDAGDASAGPLAETPAAAPEARGPKRRTVGGHALGFPLVAYGRTPWVDGLWQRPQHVLSRFSMHHPVLYVDPPHWSETDSEPRAGLGFHPVFPNLCSLTPHLPADRQGDEEYARTSCAGLLAEALARPPLAGRFDSAVAWFDDPRAGGWYAAQKAGARLTLADCYDVLPPAESLDGMDLVFAASRQLLKLTAGPDRRSHFLPNGVDTRHFSRIHGGGLHVPHDVEFIPRPVLGYFGAVDGRLDYELISALAQANDAWSVVMIGPVAGINPDHLPRRRNLYWIGKRPFHELPDYALGMDAMIAPFALTPATQHLRPAKLDEYLRCGRPAISTALPEVCRDFESMAKIGHSHEEFIALCREAIEPTRDEAAIGRGLRYTARRSWYRLAVMAERWIGEALAAKG